MPSNRRRLIAQPDVSPGEKAESKIGTLDAMDAMDTSLHLPAIGGLARDNQNWCPRRPSRPYLSGRTVRKTALEYNDFSGFNGPGGIVVGLGESRSTGPDGYQGERYFGPLNWPGGSAWSAVSTILAFP